MVTTRRKKVVKYRAHTTHGGGHRKKRRGAGSRGGRGNAGTGKRAGQKKAGRAPSLGTKGFTPGGSKKVFEKIVNVGKFTDANVKILLASGKASKEADTISVDLGKLGYTKLLGTGKTAHKLKLKVASFSAKAAEKISAAGGEVSGNDESAHNRNKESKQEIRKESKEESKQEIKEESDKKSNRNEESGAAESGTQ
jgi:large subunit ribosomal protein L15